MKASSALKIMLPVVTVMVAAIFAIGVDSDVPTICGVTVPGLFSCLPAVRTTNNTLPTPGCCDAIRPVHNLTCFCQYKSSPLVKIFSIDIDLALKLPKNCRIKGAPSHC
ncbi:hypothetical protein MLD38_038554 [Melastoma candidum]|uniref:Uncharacterized protein n=1 Tax=Melastoma candidum TaxID=119954 RepID=A0ACB9L044_9MYRT|nr:hypothetical protein MLD38_038554 [Melastoma candidum]